MPKISANLLLLSREHEAGKSQAELISELVTLGFDTVEIRREYFRDNQEAEMSEIAEIVKKNRLTLYYSVPKEVFVNGLLNPELQLYLDEAKKMGVSKIKWNIGDFANFNGDLKSALSPITSQGIEVNIENDQTQVSGRIESIQNFMEAVKAAGLDIGYVYDLGNWPFIGEFDILKAAKTLTDYVRYIHIKDDIVSSEKPVTVPLDEGELPWCEVLDVLPKDVPIALEYPTANDAIIKAGVSKLKDYLNTREK